MDIQSIINQVHLVPSALVCDKLVPASATAALLTTALLTAVDSTSETVKSVRVNTVGAPQASTLLLVGRLVV